MSIQKSNEFFESIYKQSQGDVKQIPWAELKTNSFLEEYLSMHIGEGKAIVIGCGLGEDAFALGEAGFEVTAIDISQTAIAWCQDTYDYTDIDFKVQDIFELPESMLEQYDFIFECRTIQSLPLMYRDKIIRAISSLLKPKGKILAIANGKNEGEKFDGPPWPLARNELRLFENYNCKELEFSIFAEDKGPSKMKFRALYEKE
ncbi:class I SAM-dependent methyltransferase [Sulfurimonas sp. MAG313]|nr:class I SAM-dependent methyltransferase [Sulfurimonas sp. MAG313]MDF1880908.1 class I SAM-dependent methyltransferase [Sulfurimonas sp. MAG313]